MQDWYRDFEEQFGGVKKVAKKRSASPKRKASPKKRSASPKPRASHNHQRAVGSRLQVWRGVAHHTSGGLTKKDLKYNSKTGRIVSALKSKLWHKLPASHPLRKEAAAVSRLSSSELKVRMKKIQQGRKVGSLTKGRRGARGGAGVHEEQYGGSFWF